MFHHINQLTNNHPLGRESHIRRKKKTSRLYLDHEYITEGYCAGFPHSTTAVYVVLARYANYHTQLCFPSIDTIMRDSGIRNRNTASKALRQLEAHALITIQRSPGRRTNRYLLLDTSCWQPYT